MPRPYQGSLLIASSSSDRSSFPFSFAAVVCQNILNSAIVVDGKRTVGVHKGAGATSDVAAIGTLFVHGRWSVTLAA